MNDDAVRATTRPTNPHYTLAPLHIAIVMAYGTCDGEWKDRKNTHVNCESGKSAREKCDSRALHIFYDCFEVENLAYIVFFEN